MYYHCIFHMPLGATHTWYNYEKIEDLINSLTTIIDNKEKISNIKLSQNFEPDESFIRIEFNFDNTSNVFCINSRDADSRNTVYVYGKYRGDRAVKILITYFKE